MAIQVDPYSKEALRAKMLELIGAQDGPAVAQFLEAVIYACEMHGTTKRQEAMLDVIEQAAHELRVNYDPTVPRLPRERTEPEDYDGGAE